MADNLKPCPFCGAKAVLVSNPEYSKPFGDAGTRTHIRCANRECGASVEKWAARRSWAENSVKKVWNRRVEDGK